MHFSIFLSQFKTTIARSKSNNYPRQEKSITYWSATNIWQIINFIFLNFFIFFYFCVFSRATPVACGGSQARGLISCSHRPVPEPQQHQIQAAPATYTTAHSNTGSLTHWARPGIKPATAWFLVRFVNYWAMTGTPIHYIF